MEDVLGYLLGEGGVQMSIIPLLVAGLAVGAAGMIGSAAKNGQKRSALSAMQREQNAKAAEIRAEYDASQAEDYLNSHQAQSFLKSQRDALDRQRKLTTNSAAITGATPGAVAAYKAASTQSVADTMSRLAALGDQRKQAAKQAYYGRDAAQNQIQLALSQQELGLYDAEAKSFDNLSQQGFSLAGGAAGKM